MSNFTFIAEEWPSVFDDCHHAENHLGSDPRSACFYARRAIEGLVGDIYYRRNLPQPYHSDLAALSNAPAFKQLTGEAINAKLNLIRSLGNDAVHQSRAIRPDAALTALRELFHVIVWAALRFSTIPEQVPQDATFDPRLASQSAPLSHDEVLRLHELFENQDAEHARELAANRAALEQLRAEKAALQAQVEAAHARHTVVDHHDYDETTTRDEYIDRLLHEAGWALNQPRDREYRVMGMPNPSGDGYIDYVLWGDDGLPLGIVEAKRSREDVVVGQEQARLYADRLEAATGRRPVIFYSTGYTHRIWDDAAGYAPREVQGFYTKRQLEDLITRRGQRKALSAAEVDTEIAGRPYQVRAIKAVGNSFDQLERQALLVMATGSGKTRTTIALVKQLMQAGWVKNVLFLADRKELVKQAAEAFTAHLPDTVTVNMVKHPEGTGRVYCCTYPRMLRALQQTEGTARRFTPGSFDLVVIDEAHRSVYGRYSFIFDYFDSLLVGLTATPRNEIDHNTYRLFNLEDGVPTDAYELADAVRDGYLVPPKAISHSTAFLQQGIAYDDLTEEEQAVWDSLEWDEDGLIPDEVVAPEINRYLFNADTIDKVLQVLMTDGHRTDDGETIAKTIIFAKNQRHAQEILERFDHGWPQYGGRLARVITHDTDHNDTLIDDFKSPTGSCRIAISVDMLDTGIDVPEVANLVFFKPVHSRTKFWQMVGRGTRLCPDLYGPGRDKADFRIFDFCGNLEFFALDADSPVSLTQKSLTQRNIETRIALARHLQDRPEHADVHREITAALHAHVAAMSLDNVLVRPHRAALERYSTREAWQRIGEGELEALEALAALPSPAADSDVEALRFDLLVHSHELAQLTGDQHTADRLQSTIQHIAEALLTQLAIPRVAAQAALLERVASDEWWVDLPLKTLEDARRELRGLLRFMPRTRRKVVQADFQDIMLESAQIDLVPSNIGVDIERFRQKAGDYLRAHEDEIVVQRLRRNKPLTGSDLQRLEEMLVAAGGEQAHIEWVQKNVGGLGLFVRELVGLDRAAAQEAFAQFLEKGNFTVYHIRFVDLIVEELTRNGRMEPARLFESPFTDHAPLGPESLFAADQVEHIVEILADVERHALVLGA